MLLLVVFTVGVGREMQAFPILGFDKQADVFGLS